MLEYGEIHKDKISTKSLEEEGILEVGIILGDIIKMVPGILETFPITTDLLLYSLFSGWNNRQLERSSSGRELERPSSRPKRRCQTQKDQIRKCYRSIGCLCIEYIDMKCILKKITKKRDKVKVYFCNFLLVK